MDFVLDPGGGHAWWGWAVHGTRHSPEVIPRRWVVERTSGWLMHHRRLTREITPNWRDS